MNSIHSGFLPDSLPKTDYTADLYIYSVFSTVYDNDFIIANVNLGSSFDVYTASHYW